MIVTLIVHEVTAFPAMLHRNGCQMVLILYWEATWLESAVAIIGGKM